MYWWIQVVPGLFLPQRQLKVSGSGAWVYPTELERLSRITGLKESPLLLVTLRPRAYPICALKSNGSEQWFWAVLTRISSNLGQIQSIVLFFYQFVVQINLFKELRISKVYYIIISYIQGRHITEFSFCHIYFIYIYMLCPLSFKLICEGHYEYI